MLGTRLVPPTLGNQSEPVYAKSVVNSLPDEPLRIVDVIVDEWTEPRLDDTRGSALYTVPLRLNQKPSPLLVGDLRADLEPPAKPQHHAPSKHC